MEHLDKNECVYKLSSSVKTNLGVGKIAMTQKRLFLLTEGRPGYVEISTFRNIEVRAARAGGAGPRRWLERALSSLPAMPSTSHRPSADHLASCPSVCSSVKQEYG